MPVRLLPDPLWSGHKDAVVVFTVGVSRLDKLFGSLDEPKDSVNWLMGQDVRGMLVDTPGRTDL